MHGRKILHYQPLRDRSILETGLELLKNTMRTVGPMIIVIVSLYLMEALFGFYGLPQEERRLFSDTMVYIFIFGLLATMFQNTALAGYMGDALFEERYGDVLPCFFTGLMLTMGILLVMGVPFFLHEAFAGGVDALYVLLSFVCFAGFALTIYTTLFLNQCRCYMRITLFYLAGAGGALLFGAAVYAVSGTGPAVSMLSGLSFGFLMTSALSFAQLRQYFPRNSGRYAEVLHRFRSDWKAVLSNAFYTLTLCVHNFVFWSTDLGVTAALSYVTADAYDLAAFLGILTNMTAMVIALTGMERVFQGKYKNLNDAVNGGRLSDIELHKRRVFRETRRQLTQLARNQFGISMTAFIVLIVVLPHFGVPDEVMQIYPLLAAGYFMLFMVYAAMLLLNYFADRSGVLYMSIAFFCVTLFGAVAATHLPPVFYGIGLLAGATAGWAVGSLRIKICEKNYDENTFCRGTIIPYGTGTAPSHVTYRRG